MITDETMTPSVGEDDMAAYFHDTLQPWIRSNIFILLFFAFCVAFIVAALVEESFKHFIVKYTTFTGPLLSPMSTLIYLVAGAVGFSTSESIGYIFSNSTSSEAQENGLSIFEGELLVLLLRAITPVHAICAGYQAFQLNKNIFDRQSLSLFQVLLPAIVLHGLFDFLLFAMGILQIAFYDPFSENFYESGAYIDIVSFIVAFGISLGSAIYLYRMTRSSMNDTAVWTRVSYTTNELDVAVDDVELTLRSTNPDHDTEFGLDNSDNEIEDTRRNINPNSFRSHNII